jgi:transcriptional regulator GlxA family with amidase domain
MPSTDKPEEWLSIDTRLITSAGAVALLGALLLGVATLMGVHAFLNALRDWVNQQESSPTESAKSMVKRLHDAALSSTSAATDAWRSTIAPPSTD